jgi:hypothetical protein
MTMAFQGQKQASPVTVVCKNGSTGEARDAERGGDSRALEEDARVGRRAFANQVTVLTGKPRRHAEPGDDEDVVDLIFDFLEQEGAAAAGDPPMTYAPSGARSRSPPHPRSRSSRPTRRGAVLEPLQAPG